VHGNEIGVKPENLLH